MQKGYCLTHDFVYRIVCPECEELDLISRLNYNPICTCKVKTCECKEGVPDEFTGLCENCERGKHILVA